MSESRWTGVAITACICACVAVVFQGFSACRARVSEADAATEQAAVKAGLVQGEYGRWTKP